MNITISGDSLSYTALLLPFGYPILESLGEGLLDVEWNRRNGMNAIDVFIPFLLCFSLAEYIIWPYADLADFELFTANIRCTLYQIEFKINNIICV